MRTIIELDTKDIREAIAEKYDCYPCQVSIHTKEKTVGYGLGEHTAYEVYAQIDKSRTANIVKPINDCGTAESAVNITLLGAEGEAISQIAGALATEIEKNMKETNHAY